MVYLKGKEEVEEIYYAGTGIISFTVNSVDTALKLLRNIKLITFAESLGGTESLLTYPTVQTHPDVPEEQKQRLGITDKLLRLSVGIENPEDIVADLARAFDAALADAFTLQSFFEALQKRGYMVKRGTNVKHTAIKPPGSDRFVRLDSLGDGYTEADIRERAPFW